mmetsp:Transcript_36539/g.40676  ORF Transcript_36539/g.40676 Transcript_36539/m.40676 type:complete len:129 (+) Transcript_36539:1038-1424(+)
MDKWKKKVSCGPVINGHKGIDPDAIKNMKNISYKTDNKRYNNINVSHRTPANRKKGRVDRFCLSFESIGRNRNMKSPPIPSPTYPLTQIKHHTISTTTTTTTTTTTVTTCCVLPFLGRNKNEVQSLSL